MRLTCWRSFINISGDDHHTDVQKVLSGELASPQFPDWSMGYQFLTETQLINLEKHALRRFAKLGGYQ
jgi:hypothetical protein